MPWMNGIFGSSGPKPVDYIQCMLHFNRLNIPVTLPKCKHSFCRECYMDYTSVPEPIDKSNRGSLICPVCHTDNVIPDVKKIEVNINLKDNIYPFVSRIDKIVAYTGDNTTHPGQLVDDTDPKVAAASVRTELAYCKSHGKDTLIFYCTQCEVPICKKCLDKSHEGHNIADIQSVTHGYCTELTKNVPLLRAKLRNDEIKLKQVNELMKRDSNRCDQYIKDIDRQKTAMVRKIETAAIRLKDQIEKVKERKKSCTEYYEKLVKFNMDASAKCIHFINTINESGRDATLLLNFKQLQDRIDKLSKLTDKEAEWLKEIQTVHHFKFDNSFEIGTIKHTVEPLPEIPVTPMNPIPVSTEGSLERRLNPEIQWEKTDIKSENPVPLGLMYMPDERLVTAQQNGACLKMFDTRGEVIKEVKHNGMTPYDLVYMNQHIVVTDTRFRSIKIFDSQGKHVHDMKYELYRSPKGITKHTNVKAVVVDSYLGQTSKDFTFLSILDLKTGSKIKSFGNRGEGKGELMEPQFVVVDSRRRILVTDEKLNKVEMYSTDGEYIGPFTPLENQQTGFNHKPLIAPTGICVDYNGKILVAAGGESMTDSAVYMFGEGGGTGEVLLSHRDQGIDRPMGIALNDNGMLALSEKRGFVKVFQAYTRR